MSQAGRTAFDQVKAILEFSSPLHATLAGALIITTAATAMLLHRVEIVVTHWDLGAKPKVGFRLHIVNISSFALYLGLGAQFIAMTSIIKVLLSHCFNELRLPPGPGSTLPLDTLGARFAEES